METADHHAHDHPRRRGGALLILSPLLCALACSSPPPRSLPSIDSNAPPPRSADPAPREARAFFKDEIIDLNIRRELRFEGCTSLKGRASAILNSEHKTEVRLRAELRRLNAFPIRLGLYLEERPEVDFQLDARRARLPELTRSDSVAIEAETAALLLEAGFLLEAKELLLQRGLADFSDEAIKPQALRSLLGPGLVCKEARRRLIGPGTDEDRPVDVFRVSIKARSAWIEGAELAITGEARYAIDTGRLVSINLTGIDSVEGRRSAVEMLPRVSGFAVTAPAEERVEGRLSFALALRIRSRGVKK